MGRRVDLHNHLVSLLGSTNVYFQPPESIAVQYPCIVYSLSSNDVRFADDGPYSITRRYQLTLIDRDPDNLIVDKISQMPYCHLDRTFTTSNLHHYVFDVYY
jgi:hypothetical protein